MRDGEYCKRLYQQGVNRDGAVDVSFCFHLLRASMACVLKY